MGTNLEELNTLWNQWELRLLVLTSLSFQIILILLASRRKHSTSSFVNIILWSAYLLADIVATTTLGILSKTQADYDAGSRDSNIPSPSKLNNQYVAFWSPFLLLHLGGPDNITAFSLEDNQLWLRHLLGLIFQVGLAAYVFVRSFLSISGSQLWILTILMFLAGIIKYGERTWALMSANKDDWNVTTNSFCNYNSITDATSPIHDILLGHGLFLIYRPLFLDNNVDIIDKDTFRFLVGISSEDAFKAIEMALQFTYEFLYTKAFVIHTQFGYILRFISFSSILSALMLFLFFVDNDNKLGHLDNADMVITYIILGGALVLEIYHVIPLIFSEWTLVSLNKKGLFRLQNEVLKLISFFQAPKKPRWSNSMGQYNLVRYCHDSVRLKPTMFKTILDLLGVDEIFLNYRHTTRLAVTEDVKQLMFKKNLFMIDNYFNTQYTGRRYEELLLGGWASNRGRMYMPDISRQEEGPILWSVECDFDKSIILWYLATYICYYSDSNSNQGVVLSKTRQASMELSNYMLYLLATFPFLSPPSPIGTWLERSRKLTTAFFQASQIPRGESVESHFSKLLLERNDGNIGSGMLLEAIRLARTLQEWGIERKWEIVSDILLQMLLYAARQLGGSQHVQQLRRGGEFLTHVWLLEAHLIQSRFHGPNR